MIRIPGGILVNIIVNTCKRQNVQFFPRVVFECIPSAQKPFNSECILMLPLGYFNSYTVDRD